MRRRNKILQILNDPTKNFLAFFFFTVILLNILSNGVSNFFWENLSPILQQYFKIEHPTVFQLLALSTLLGITLLIIYFTSFAGWIRQKLAGSGLLGSVEPERVYVQELTECYRGLVVIMSPKEDSPAEIAIRHHWNNGSFPRLEHCWIICTEESVPFARRLEQKLVQEGISEHLMFYYGDFVLPNQERSLNVNMAEMHNPDYILNLVNGIYVHAEFLGLSEEELIIDFTGGTKPLGVGAFLACVNPECHAEYIAQQGESRTSTILEITVAYRIKAVR
ncbi:hypothetical protein [[Limnothrix rosea] IAM M-220]|uniref:hypothetical protein n=1 Tax=[Limnothrix rosea] IAM M-220 TaxID=454133 RepID=UPI00095C57E7|nr:hypothetical protein [[Limnothrix rosea] IAM M-220]OKH11428.1 hypothetical protein NIES208_17350 [[Limnothrix rosea] IAM M-220]